MKPKVFDVVRHYRLGDPPYRRNKPGELRATAYGLLLALWFMAMPALAEEPPDPSPEAVVLKALTVWSANYARSGERIILSVVIQIAEGFHINADPGQLAENESFSPYPTRVQILDRNPSVVAGTPEYPPAHTIEVGFSPQPLSVFDGQTVVTIPVVVPTEVTASTLKIHLALHYQGCDATSCWRPQTVELTAELPMAPTRFPRNSAVR